MAFFFSFKQSKRKEHKMKEDGKAQRCKLDESTTRSRRANKQR